MRRPFLTLPGTIAACLLFVSPSGAQVMVDVPIWSNGMLGQQALRNTYDNFNEANGIDDDGDRPDADADGRTCSADALPAQDRRRMEEDYVRRLREDGKASADAWVREQGIRFRQQLEAEGVCSPSR